MRLTRREFPVLIANALYLPVFTILAWRNDNHEFLLYIAVVLLVGGWTLWKQRQVQFTGVILWGLTLWGFLHMAGGNIRVGDGVLYSVVVLPIAARHNILRFDQIVHFLGFGVATLVAHHLLRPYLRANTPPTLALAVLVIFMGSGFGAVNEILEFIAVLWLPETGVGGYENTLWDLVFNLLGGVVAVGCLRITGRLGKQENSCD